MGDDEGAGRPGEIGGEILGDLFGEVILLRIAALVGERQDDEGQRRPRRVARGDSRNARGKALLTPGRDVRPVQGSGEAEAREEQGGEGDEHGPRQPDPRHGRLRRRHRIDAHRPCDVPQPLRAEIGKADVEPVAHVPIGGFRQAQAPGLRRRLQAGRDVDAVAEQVALVHHHVAEMDADAQAEPPRIPVGLGQRPLDGHGAGDGIRRAGEFGEHAVPGRVGDPPAMRRDQAVDDLAGRLEGPHGTALVVMHRLGVAGDVGGEDRRRTTFRDRPLRRGRPARPLAHGDLSTL